jgi:uncharacterized protein (TIGR00251 family)
MMDVKPDGGAIVFAVRVQPRASRDEIVGEWNGALKIRLTAPPVDDRANEACCCLLAARLNVPVAAVRIVSGARSRNKRVAVRGVSAEQVRKLLKDSG